MGSFFYKFDATEQIEYFFDRWAENPNSKYFQHICASRRRALSDEQIKQEIIDTWTKKGEIASAAGTFMHRQIELFLNGFACDVSSIEMMQFRKFLLEIAAPKGWVPYRTEWSIFSERHMVAGQIDCIFYEVGTGHFHMVDWKRVEKDLSPDDGAAFKRFGHGPCSQLLDNKYIHYALQQNLYAVILEDNYGIELGSLSLLQLHVARAAYSFISVPKMYGIARSMLEIASQQGCTTAHLPGTIVERKWRFDRLGGMLLDGKGNVNTEDDLWVGRRIKRQRAVAAIKKSSQYQEMIRLPIVAQRPLTPDPEDRRYSKRSWEASVGTWRKHIDTYVRLNFDSDQAQPNAMSQQLPQIDVKTGENCDGCHCLTDSLNALLEMYYLQVPTVVGYLWALWDGNRLLARFNLALTPTLSISARRRGLFIAHRAFHFTAIIHSDCVVFVDQEMRWRPTANELDTLIDDPEVSLFELVPSDTLTRTLGEHYLKDVFGGAIAVSMLSGEQLWVELADHATIKDLKGAIKHLIGVNRRNQQIIVDGRVAKSRSCVGMHEQITLVISNAKCVCGNEGVKICAGCNDVVYCSRECQRRDWKLHKSSCCTQAVGAIGFF